MSEQAKTVAYFGCWDQPGHYLHTAGGKCRGYEAVGPWTAGKLDDPDRWHRRKDAAPLIDGVRLHYVDGWTLMCMIDNSVDTRPGSHAIFLAEGTHTQEAMWILATDAFPFIAARLLRKSTPVHK